MREEIRSHRSAGTALRWTPALAIVAFFWIHYSSVVFIIGTEIGQLYRERHSKKPKK